MEQLRDLVIRGYKPRYMKKWDCFSHLLMPLKDCERTLKETFLFICIFPLVFGLLCAELWIRGKALHSVRV